MKTDSSIEINIARGDATWQFVQSVEDEDLPSFQEMAEALGRLSETAASYLRALNGGGDAKPPTPF
jgi:hypothetical protein